MPRRVRGGILQKELEDKLHSIYDTPELVTLKDKALEIISFILSKLTDEQKTRGNEISSVLGKLLTASEADNWKEMNMQLVDLYQALFPLPLVQARIRKIEIIEFFKKFYPNSGRGKRSKRGGGPMFSKSSTVTPSPLAVRVNDIIERMRAVTNLAEFQVVFDDFNRLGYELTPRQRRSPEIAVVLADFLENEYQPIIFRALKTERIRGLPDDPNIDNCGICLERIDDGSLTQETSCRHRFHQDCFYKYSNHPSSKVGALIKCPICRKVGAGKPSVCKKCGLRK